MATRPPVVSSTEGASSLENPRKMLEPKSTLEKKKKRPALADITNGQIRPLDGSRVNGSLPKSLAPCSIKHAQKKGLPASTLPERATIGAGEHLPYNVHDSTMPKPEVVHTSPMATGSLSADETMSTCDSLKSPEYEYLDNENSSGLPIVEGKNIIVHDTRHNAEKEASGKTCETNILDEMEPTPNASTADKEDIDSQLYSISALKIYKNLRDSEDRKRPSSVYMESVQRDINASMRAILVDWLVEVAEEYRLVPETVHLSINYIDRYLSGNSINRKQLQLLGVACMMIAAKYEEVSIPMVEEFCYVTDNTYSKQEVLQMEKSVLKHLKFDMAIPTANCFLRLVIHTAQETVKISSVKFECLASYITELSLAEYHMLRYAPSIIAASAIFLARFMLCPSEKPWNLTLSHHTMYQPSELCDCVKALHRLCLNSCSYLPAVRQKYSRHKYKFVAKKYCPITIPPAYFED